MDCIKNKSLFTFLAKILFDIALTGNQPTG
jgi:hypothetical protein